MQRASDGVAPSALAGLSFLVGDAASVKAMPGLRQLPIFDDGVLRFLNDLSKALLRAGRAYSDVATFGFWCRRSALLQEKLTYDDRDERLGSGVVFHSTPSNDPVNFAFSFATGLLAGNANIVRLPAKDFAQVRVICDAVRELLAGEHQALAPYLAMLKYPPDKAITDALTSLCDTRVVWGGDATIAEMRQSPLKPRANEITFADRHSIAVIDADAYLASQHKERIAQDFYNDTYFSDQNACTAPRLVVWLGRSKAEAQREFWASVYALAREKYELAPVQAVGKLAALDLVASRMRVRLVDGVDNLLYRVKADELTPDLMRYKHNSGFFFEYDAEGLDDILPIADERCQTLTYFGLKEEALRAFFLASRPRGIDRAVPMGKSMDFTLVWDGHDLIRELSRRIIIGND